MPDLLRLPTVPVLLQAPAPLSVTWNAVAVPGAFEGHPAGPFELNEKVFSNIIRNFRSDPLGRVRVDLNHISETMEGSALDCAFAPAWITDLKMDGGKLLGRFEWTDQETMGMVRDGKLCYLSPSISFRYTDPVTGEDMGVKLRSVALTNDPFLRNIPVVNASHRASLPVTDVHLPGSAGVKTKKGHTMADEEKDESKASAGDQFMKYMKRMRARLKLADSAEMEDVEMAMDDLMKKHEMSEAREAKRMSDEADALVLTRVESGVVPNTPEAIASAKTLCLSNRATFDVLFPEGKKAAKKETDKAVSATEAALLTNKVLNKNPPQGGSVVGEAPSYRVQLMTLANEIAEKLRKTDPTLDEYAIEMKASSEARYQLTAQAVERIAR